jgi:hemolysin activation/secretion protein
MLAVALGGMLLPGVSALAQTVPAPSQVAPPAIPPAPGGGRIVLPQVPAGAQIPPQARQLRFKLTGFDISGEFEELVAARRTIAAPLIGKRVTVADVFEFADKLQQIYVRAGYTLVRVVILPQEFEGSARIKLRVIDGYIEKMDLDTLPAQVRERVTRVLEPLLRKHRLTQAELERQLLLAGETPGLTLNATFSAGKDVGGSVLVLSGRYRPVSFSVYADNAMPTVFGTGQLVTTASLNSLLGYGEQLTATVAGLPDRDFTTEFPTRRYLNGTYSMPLGIDGFKLELGATDSTTTPRVSASTATQGQMTQARIKLSFDVVKRRDIEFALYGQMEATDEEIDTLLFTPQVPLSIDRVRPLRAGFEGIWRLRETGTTVSFGAAYSHGFDWLGARTAADANPITPLSRQGADAVFDKLNGHIELNQALPYALIATLNLAGQTSFNNPLLTSEQFDLTGARYMSGFTSGALPGDSGWVVRGELGRPFAVPLGGGGMTVTPYGFAATGERIYIQPTVLELASLHATNYGAGVRLLVPAWAEMMPDGYGFIEWSHRTTTTPSLDGDRLFAGILLRY